MTISYFVFLILPASEPLSASSVDSHDYGIYCAGYVKKLYIQCTILGSILSISVKINLRVGYWNTVKTYSATPYYMIL